MTVTTEAFRSAVKAAHTAAYNGGEDSDEQVRDLIWNKHLGVPFEVKADVLREIAEEATAHAAELLACRKQRDA